MAFYHKIYIDFKKDSFLVYIFLQKNEEKHKKAFLTYTQILEALWKFRSSDLIMIK